MDTESQNTNVNSDESGSNMDNVENSEKRDVKNIETVSDTNKDTKSTNNERTSSLDSDGGTSSRRMSGFYTDLGYWDLPTMLNDMYFHYRGGCTQCSAAGCQGKDDTTHEGNGKNKDDKKSKDKRDKDRKKDDTTHVAGDKNKDEKKSKDKGDKDKKKDKGDTDKKKKDKEKERKMKDKKEIEKDKKSHKEEKDKDKAKGDKSKNKVKETGTDNDKERKKQQHKSEKEKNKDKTKQNTDKPGEKCIMKTESIKKGNCTVTTQSCVRTSGPHAKATSHAQAGNQSDKVSTHAELSPDDNTQECPKIASGTAICTDMPPVVYWMVQNLDHLHAVQYHKSLAKQTGACFEQELKAECKTMKQDGVPKEDIKEWKKDIKQWREVNKPQRRRDTDSESDYIDDDDMCPDDFDDENPLNF